MKVVVIGLGSMGRRRIRLLRLFDSSIEIIGIDKQDERRKQTEKEYNISTYYNFESACIQNPTIDIAFVSTSPLSHSGMVRECLKKRMHVFSEINLVDEGYDENIRLAKNNSVTLFLSSTPMYRKEIEYIISSARENDSPKSYIYHVGQYLPDWHPWENYRDFFVNDKRTNGCRELMAIEFPWLFETFGFPVEWRVNKRKNSSLDLDYPDTFQIMFTHDNANRGFIQIDIVSRKAVRNFECIAENLYLTWDGTPKGLCRYDYELKKDISIDLYDSVDKRSEYSASIIEDSYLDEIREFFDVIKGRTVPRYSFQKDKRLLSVIDDIEDIG